MKKPSRPKPAPSAAVTPALKLQMAPAAPVLLAVTGMSPAILTETIWALAHETEPVIPARVIVVTTSDGRKQIDQLFIPNPDFAGQTPWDALRTALQAKGHNLTGRLRFGTTGDDVCVITATDPKTGRSRELTDLRSPSDNEASADFFLERVRSIVENPDTPLVASLAGGRKTMGALLYACLTLVGRETDRLTHVLVNEPFETMRGFWFPGQPGGVLPDREGKPHAPKSARVELADVPFVPLRNLFQRELGRRAGSFQRLVEQCREEVRRTAGEDVRLVVERSRCQIEINGTRVTFAPREHLVLLFLANRAKSSQSALAKQTDATVPIDEFRNALVQSAPNRDLSDWRHSNGLMTSLDDQDVRKALSGIRSKLRETGGNASKLLACIPEKGRFSLAVPGSLIHLKD